MKILLVKAANITSRQNSIIPPLGLLYLGAMVKTRRIGDEVFLLDMQVESDKALATKLREWQPDVVGIGAMTVESGHAYALAELAKRLAPEAIVVMGGPHPTSYNAEVLKNQAVDYTVLHEGELTFIELLDVLQAGSDPKAVAGIGFRDEHGNPQTTPARPYIDDLDTLPLPDWTLIDFAHYENVKSMSLVGPRRVAPIMTSRACPYRCTYCHNMFGKKFQKRSVENVLNEMQLLVERYNIRELEIIDDIFNIDKERTRQILQGILDRRLNVRLAFPNGLRGDLLTEELVDLFARAGTKYVSIAVETASPRLQKYIRKHLKLDKIQDAIRWFVERRVFTNCFYMLGFPTETVAEINGTVDFACRQPSHTAMFLIVTPFGGTELVEQVKNIGVDYHMEFDRYAYHESNLNVSGGIPTSLLHRTAKLAYFRFLANPNRLWRLMRDHPNKRYLWQMGWLLLHRLFFDNLNNRSLIERLRMLASGRRESILVERRKAEGAAAA